jgi:WD40 repeat protein
VGLAAGLAAAFGVIFLLRSLGRDEDTSTWKEFVSAEGRFRVLLPGEPERKTQQIPTPMGACTLYAFVWENKRRDFALLVSYNDYPPVVNGAPPDQVLDGVRDGVVMGTPGARLNGEQRITLHGYPGREVRVDIPGKGTLRNRMYLVQNRLYQLSAPRLGGGGPSEETITRFLDSFSFTPPPAAVAGPEPHPAPAPKPAAPPDRPPAQPPPPVPQTPGRLLAFRAGPPEVHALVFAPDGKTLATASERVVRLWDVATGQERQKLQTGNSRIGFAAFSPDGKWLAVRKGDVGISLRDARGEQVAEVPAENLWGVAFSPDSKTLAAASGSYVRFWDVETREQGPFIQDGPGVFISVAFTPDGKTLAAAGYGNGLKRKCKLWDLQTRQARADLGEFGDTWFKVAMSPDGHYLASVGRGSVVRLADVPAGRGLPSLPEGPQGVSWVAFNHDSKGLFTWGPDGLVRLYDVLSRQQRASFRVQGVAHLAVSPDGTRLAAYGSGEISIWDAAVVLAPKQP